MPSITIRDVPQETRNELAARAARNGQSLQEYLRAMFIDAARREDMNAVLDRIDARRRSLTSGVTTERVREAIQSGRDERDQRMDRVLHRDR